MPSRTGSSDLDAVGSDRGPGDLERFQFDTPVAPGGYRWVYADAVSKDRRYGLVLIALIGSVFSPYYAWSGRHSPINHCALNVCLYGPGVGRWGMTERRAGSVEAQSDSLSIGPSHIRLEDGALKFEINERSAPLFRPLRGTVVIRPEIEQGKTFILDQNQRHVWRPVWPRAHVEARFEDPDFNLDGDGYVDMNAGSEPLEAGFDSWNWARTSTQEGAAIVYDSLWKGAGGSSLTLDINKEGRAEPFEMPPAHPLPQTVWRVPREARSDATPQLTRTLEDTPFYTRSLIETDMLGQRCQVMHESLDLKRFSSNWVKCLLPFRMPRELG